MDKETIRVLVVDKEDDSYRTIKELLGDSASVGWSGNGTPFSYDFDVYIIDNQSGRLEDIIDIHNNTNADVFVFSANGDYELVKKLMKMNISGFIDKTQMDHDIFQVSKIIRKSTEQRAKYRMLAEKLDGHLEALNAMTIV